MAAFVATYASPNGQKRNITIQASSLTDAKKQLRRRGIRANDLKPVQSISAGGFEKKQITQNSLKTTSFNNLFEKAPGIKDKAVFASKLAALIDAGVPIVRSLDLMAGQQKLPMFKRALAKVSSEVNEGIALATALQVHSCRVTRPSDLCVRQPVRVGCTVDYTSYKYDVHSRATMYLVHRSPTIDMYTL